MKIRFRPKPEKKSAGLSLFYRENLDATEHGDIPHRYLRVASEVSGDRVLEMGAAEGTLCLLLAQRKRYVIGVEPHPQRVAVAVQRIAAAQPLVGRVSFVYGDVRDHLSLLDKVDTFVGMRCIYYLREDIGLLFDAIAERVPEVVLTGNAEREARFASGDRSKLGEYERYATLEGMTELLQSRGYQITLCEAGVPNERDPMVVARRV